MSYVKILIHAVWGTKSHNPYLNKDVKSTILNHIEENAKKKRMYIDTVNSHFDHVHCLFYLNADMSVSKALNLIKGESSFWINKQKLFKSKFEWADEFFAASVSETQKGKVREYILNQDEHHRNISFQEEYAKFMKSYGFKLQG